MQLDNISNPYSKNIRVPSINVIQHKNHASDGQVELDARKGK